MILSLIGMAGSGKSYWSMKLAEHGFRRFCCDDLIAARLGAALTRPDGSISDMSEWMGFPYESRYKNRESEYLNHEIEVLAEILGYLEGIRDRVENIVVDTTGSVIYTGAEMLERLNRYTTVVYLATPPEVRVELFKTYLNQPHPMLWRDVFHRKSHETNEDALTRCFPLLVSARERLYEQYAEVTIGYFKRRTEGFGVQEFLHEVSRAKGS